GLRAIAATGLLTGALRVVPGVVPGLGTVALVVPGLSTVPVALVVAALPRLVVARRRRSVGLLPVRCATVVAVLPVLLRVARLLAHGCLSCVASSDGIPAGSVGIHR